MTVPARTPGGDPSARISAVFEAVAATRMRDFPLANPALRIEAVGMRVWQGLWVGVLVTPWAMNLLLLPADGAAADFRLLATGQEQHWSFPSGEYGFYGLAEADLGPCQMCSLASPLLEYRSHEEAVAVAHEILSALFAAEPAARPAAAAAPSCTRRDFLRGRTTGAGR